MNHQTVEKLEEKIEAAISEITGSMDLKKLPLLPDRHPSPDRQGAGHSVFEEPVPDGCGSKSGNQASRAA